MPRFYSKDTLLIRDAWRKAFREGGLRFNFPDEAKAHRARMMFYAAVRQEKQGKGDGELVRAAETLEIVFGETKNVLLMRPRQDNPIFQAISEAVGLDLDHASMPEADESLKLLEEMGVFVEGSSPPSNDNARTGAGAREEGSDGIATEHQDNIFYGKREK
jgi:hypothetical protein